MNSDFATESTEYSQSVYSVFCTDKTVCAGYAQSFAMMCNGSGIDTAVVTSSNHEWNKVKYVAPGIMWIVHGMTRVMVIIIIFL